VLTPEDAPQVANRPLSITCEVEAKTAHGVLVAHGGSAVGYALYLKDGRMIFAVHATGQATASITSKEIPSGRFTAEARLAADGSMTLALNGQVAATGKAEGLLARQPQENFCVGHDDGVPVTTYADGKPFQGVIEKLQVTVGTKN
jgi:arylsulfatase